MTTAPDPAERAELLLAAPAGCAVLLFAEQAGLSPEQVAEPGTSMALAVDAVRELNPWRGDDLVQRLHLIRQQAAHLADLAQAVAEHPDAQWWWQDLDRHAQHEPLRRGHQGEPPALPSAPDEPSTGWDLYAQKSRTGTWSSTVVQGTSSLVTIISRGAGDVAAADWFGISQVTVHPSARVREIHGPDDWHRLCADHPATYEGAELPVLADTLVPDWQSVARDLDAIHLSLGGLLTTIWVPRVSAAGRSTLWSWEFEGTHWLRPSYDRALPEPFAFRDDRDVPWHALDLPDGGGTASTYQAGDG